MSTFQSKYQDLKSINELVGKTIKSVTVIQAEYGRTMDRYLCVVFTDGKRQLMGENFSPYEPNPNLEEMKKASEFFTIDDMTEKVKNEELNRRHREMDEKNRKMREFEQLKKELGK